MLANLITTILLALGVVTNGVNQSGNAFNNENKTKPIQKANEQYQITLNTELKSEWSENHPTNPNVYYYNEYKRYELNYNNQNTNPLVLPDKIIYNSVYTFEYAYYDDPSGTASWGRRNDYIAIYEITNVYNSVTTFNMNCNMVLSSNSTPFYREWNITNYLSNDESIRDLIGLTMNASVRDRVITDLTNANKTILDQTITAQSSNETVQPIQNTTSEIVLQPNETKFLIMWVYLNHSSNGSQAGDGIIPQNPVITSNYVAPTQTTEIVDIPNLMFTILTMPFAWFSTAFNLTIFPNTPYALNFGNAILTIIAAMTLLYLLRKILH